MQAISDLVRALRRARAERRAASLKMAVAVARQASEAALARLDPNLPALEFAQRLAEHERAHARWVKAISAQSANSLLLKPQ